MTAPTTTRKPVSARKLAKRKAWRAANVAAIKAVNVDEFELDGGRELRAFTSLCSHYSEGNAMLIMKQAVDLGLKVNGLSDVGGFNAFAERGRKPRDGEDRLLLIWAHTGSSEQADKTEETIDAAGRKVRHHFAVIGIYHVSQTDKVSVE
jgi:hypothetical protein